MHLCSTIAYAQGGILVGALVVAACFSVTHADTGSNLPSLDGGIYQIQPRLGWLVYEPLHLPSNQTDSCSSARPD